MRASCTSRGVSGWTAIGTMTSPNGSTCLSRKRATSSGCAVCQKGPGTAFNIEPIPGDLTDFKIGGGLGAAGRAYVDGILCRLDAPRDL